MDIIFLVVLTALVISFLAAEIVSLRRWRGWWRVGAVLPCIAFLGLILNIVIGTMRDRTAHNLWPLEIVLWSVGGLIFLGILSIAHKIAVVKK
jgi:hypothetical protein